MKKIYLVEVERCGYDEYDSVVVIANNEQEAIDLCKCDNYDKEEYYAINGYFLKSQGKITAKEIDLNTETQVILASFNAG